MSVSYSLNCIGCNEQITLTNDNSIEQIRLENHYRRECINFILSKSKSILCPVCRSIEDLLKMGYLESKIIDGNEKFRLIRHN